MIRSISLIGTTSCGKSTIGNLLSGHYILPTGVQETTVSVIELFHNINYCLPTLFMNNNNLIYKTQLKCDEDMRGCINNAMLSSSSESGNIYIRLRISMNVFHKNWRGTVGYNIRKLFLKRLPLPHELGFFKNSIIRDFPGFQYEQDINRIGLIRQHLDGKGIILFIFNAEETDSFKEDNLLKYLFTLLYDQGHGWESVLFVLNRKDAFYRDNNPRYTLRQALNNRQKRIRQIISDIWKQPVETDITIIPISAGLAFAAEMLCWFKNSLSKNDLNHLQNKIEKEAVILLPENIKKTLPRSAGDWNYIQWLNVSQAIYYRSGLAYLINRLKVNFNNNKL